MIAHTDTNILHLILLVISRKMLVYSDTMLDLLFATTAIAILFAVRKYLLTGARIENEKNKYNEFSATTTIKRLNSKYGFEIDPKDSKTIGGYVYALLVKNAEEPEIGVIVDDGKCIYQIMSMSSGGVIETVSIEKIDKN